MDQTATAFAKGRIRISAIHLPSVTLEFADRLAELDTKNSYVYADYSSVGGIVLYGIELLRTLIQEAVATSLPENKARVAKALVAQVSSLKKDLTSLAEKEIAVLELILKQNKKFDAQVIARAKNNLAQAKKASERNLVEELNQYLESEKSPDSSR